MTGAEALQLTDRLRDAKIQDWDGFVVDAHLQRAWRAMGYRSWDQYCYCELHGERPRFSRQDRLVIVHNLTEWGLPTKVIASAVNIGASTVISDRRRMQQLLAAGTKVGQKSRGGRRDIQRAPDPLHMVLAARAEAGNG